MTRAPIAVVVHDLGTGGVQRVMSNLANGLAELGEVVHLLTPDVRGREHHRLLAGVEVRELRGARFAGFPGLIGYLTSARPRGVISAVTRTNLACLIAARSTRSRCRVIVTKHIPLSQLLSQRGVSSAWVRSAIRFGYPFADAIVAVSEGTAEDLARTARIPRSRIEVVANPVITPELLDAARAPLHHDWFASDAPPVVVGIGRLTPQKDFATLIRAFALVRASRESRLVILGEGEERGKLESLARELGVSADVWLPGHVANPYTYLRRSRAFALSSRFEGLPTVLIEALAVGTPVVATNCPAGPYEILEGGRLGRLVPVGSPEVMANALCDALRDRRSPPESVDLTRYTRRNAAEAYLRVVDREGG